MMKNDIIFEIAKRIENNLRIERDIEDMQKIFFEYKKYVYTTDRMSEKEKDIQEKKIEEILNKLKYVKTWNLRIFHDLQDLIIMMIEDDKND